MVQIKKLQQSLGVTADGIIGQNTLKAFANKYGKSKEQAAQFFANVHHETAGFSLSEESLNYSTAKRIREVWPSRFIAIEDAQPYVRNPEGLANKVYGNRMGNVSKGDGWKFRGRGALQLTGRDNFLEFSEWVGDAEIMNNPSLVSSKYYWDSALFFFEKNGVWKLADGLQSAQIENTRRRINGGLNGIKEVRSLISKYLIK